MHSYRVITDCGDPISVTAFLPGHEALIASCEHPMFLDILEALRNDTSILEVKSLFDAIYGLEDRFTKVSKKIQIDKVNGTIIYDGELMHGALADTIVRFYFEKNQDFQPLVKFLEKIKANPSTHSKENLYRWLNNLSFMIDDEGFLIGYKGIQEDMHSVSSGGAFVDGIWHPGRVPNYTGTNVSMLRKNVQFDPAIGCSYGLHVGTWAYASGFGPVTIRVRVNPKDVVSVPTDCQDQKMRVSSYDVVDIVDSELKTLLVKL